MATSLLIENILAKYELTPARIDSRQMGYRNHSYRATLNTGEIVNLVIYKREPEILQRIRRANFVSDYLSAAGFPTRRTRNPGIIRLSTDNYLRYAAVYSYLPGTTIPWEAYTKRHLKLLGSTMSDMHHSLARLKDPTRLLSASTAAGDYRQITERMHTYFNQPGVVAATATTLGLRVNSKTWPKLDQILTICTRLPVQQPLHMDFVRGNILFEQTTGNPVVTGLIDFEKTAIGPPVMDIARTLAFLLVDSKFKTVHHTRKYFLDSGYNKRGRTTFRQTRIRAGRHELDVLECLIDLFLLHDFYKFLRHNPYESLQLNEHFVRTKALLLARGILSLATDRVSIARDTA